MAVVNRQIVSAASTIPTYNTASGGGDKIQNPKGCIVIIKNASGAPITATFDALPTFPNGTTMPDLVVTVPATTGERWVVLGDEYTDANGQCSIAWSAATSVTFAVLSL